MNSKQNDPHRSSLGIGWVPRELEGLPGVRLFFVMFLSPGRLDNVVLFYLANEENREFFVVSRFVSLPGKENQKCGSFPLSTGAINLCLVNNSEENIVFQTKWLEWCGEL